jgi:hypothetical protein
MDMPLPIDPYAADIAAERALECSRGGSNDAHHQTSSAARDRACDLEKRRNDWTRIVDSPGGIDARHGQR